MNIIHTLIIVAAATFLHTGAAIGGRPLVVAGFTVAGPVAGGADPVAFSDHLRRRTDVDIWGLSGVASEGQLQRLLDAADESGGGLRSFSGLLGNTGGGDHLAILYDNRRLRRHSNFELINLVQDRCGRKKLESFRAPMVGIFEELMHGQYLVFMVNHLDRDDPTLRVCQARALNDWSATSINRGIPRIAVGTYNFDIAPAAREASRPDPGLGAVTRNDLWKWIRPDPLRATRCPDRDGTVADLVLAGARAADWRASASVLFGNDPTYCAPENPGGEARHRPVWASFDLR